MYKDILTEISELIESWETKLMIFPELHDDNDQEDLLSVLLECNKPEIEMSAQDLVDIKILF